MTLCSNRFEGFGPHSNIHPSVPTQCFEDVIVIPLATWLYMLITIVAIPVALRQRRRSRPASSMTEFTYSDKVASPARTTILQRILQIIYYFLIVAMLAMVSLEIARSVVAQIGIGLMPFNYVGIWLALVVHIGTERNSRLAFLSKGDGKRRGMLRFVSAFFWITLLVAMALKIAGVQLEISMGYSRTGQQAQYPLSDEVTDTATMIGVEFVLAILEIVAL